MGKPTFTISQPTSLLYSPPIPCPIHLHLPLHIRSHLSRSRPKTTTPSRPSIPNARTPGPPARDRVIDFGKHKGRMLGSLPSSYLNWISKNLRAGDTEEWARWADQVLADPVYRDRIEWEAAEKILSGESACSAGRGSDGGSVAELLEISERFGWDNEDKAGWGSIDFGLLGTSKGGRIPKAADRDILVRPKEERENGTVRLGDGVPSSLQSDGGRRRERRERARVRRVERTISGGVGKGENEMGSCGDSGAGVAPNAGGGVQKRFPGREALLRKVLNGGGRLNLQQPTL